MKRRARPSGARPIVACLLLVLAAACRETPPAVDDETGAVETTTTPVDLYFPGDGARLHAERRELELPTEPVERVRALAEAVLAGPVDESLVAPLPPEIEVASVYLGLDGIAYVDLSSPDRSPPPGSGSAEELQVVFSLVNSIAVNVDQVRRVVLLWNGEQPATFAGHLDTSRPFAPDLGIVAP